jgi:Protein of unknown function (DUF2971)
MNSVHASTARDVLAEPRLYKFRSMADDQQKDRLRDIVLGHRIRFSRPSELNDPIEGKPIYSLGDWSSEQYRTQFAEWAWRCQRHVAQPPPQEAFCAWLVQQSQEVHQGYISQINADNQAEIERRWRVLSLSADARNHLMWSHYADGHKGVALVFDASHGEFALAYKVSYVPQRQPMEITTQDQSVILKNTLLTKLDTWDYEKEFRCIAPEVPERGALHVDNQFLRFAPPRLVGIISGAKLSPENEAEILSWSLQRKIPLELSRVIITDAGSVEILAHAL